MRVLHRLVDTGNTVLVIEHHIDVVKQADWVIDLGPFGGDRGGEIVAEGPPERIARTPGSQTGRYLRIALDRAEDRAAQEAAATSTNGNGRKPAAKRSKAGAKPKAAKAR